MVTPRSLRGRSFPASHHSVDRERPGSTDSADFFGDFFQGPKRGPDLLRQHPAEPRLGGRRPDRRRAEGERRVRHDAGRTPPQRPDRAVAGVLAGRGRREVRVAVAVDVEEADRAAEVVARLRGTGDAVGVLGEALGGIAGQAVVAAVEDVDHARPALVAERLAGRAHGHVGVTVAVDVTGGHRVAEAVLLLRGARDALGVLAVRLPGRRRLQTGGRSEGHGDRGLVRDTPDDVFETVAVDVPEGHLAAALGSGGKGEGASGGACQVELGPDAAVAEVDGQREVVAAVAVDVPGGGVHHVVGLHLGRAEVLRGDRLPGSGQRAPPDGGLGAERVVARGTATAEQDQVLLAVAVEVAGLGGRGRHGHPTGQAALAAPDDDRVPGRGGLPDDQVGAPVAVQVPRGQLVAEVLARGGIARDAAGGTADDRAVVLGQTVRAAVHDGDVARALLAADRGDRRADGEVLVAVAVEVVLDVVDGLRGGRRGAARQGGYPAEREHSGYQWHGPSFVRTRVGHR